METSKSVVTSESAPALNPKGYPVELPLGVPHYDYANQCWISAAGRVERCGHARLDQDGCYACSHAGEPHTCQGECA